MFSASRLLRATKPVQRCATNFLAPSSLRLLHSTTPRHNAPAATPKSESVFSDTIEKYGVAPFLGLGAIALLSKEVFVVDAEFFLALDMVLAVFTGYVVAGDSVNKHFEDVHKARMTRMDAALEAAIASVEMYKMNKMNITKEVDVMKQYQKEWVQAETAYCNYLTTKPKIELYKETVAKLESIKNQEAQEASEAAKNEIAEAIAFVRSKFDDKDVRNEMMQLAISNIGADPETSEAEDPVKRLFTQYFDKE